MAVTATDLRVGMIVVTADGTRLTGGVPNWP
jgi:hypothetical protein